MHIDPFTIVIFTIIISLLMSAGLFVVSRDYLTDVKGVHCWATALLLMATSWLLLALYGIIPNFFSLVIGTTLGFLALVFYFHALVAFKEFKVSVRWLYVLVAIVFIGHIYFVHISFNMAAKIVLTSLSVAVVLLANSFLLLTKQHGVCPRSHRLTAAFFAFASCVYVIRAIYYLVWNIQPEQTLFQHNIVQDIAYLTNAIFIVGTSFGFALMCNEKYLTEKNQAQVDLKKSVSLLNTILESTEDALLAVDLTGKITKYNSLFVKMWAIPELMFNAKSDELLLNFVLSQLVDKESFINEVINIYKHLHDDTFSELHFNDGRIIERYSRPQYLNDEPVGRVWSFRDVTERKRMEQRLRDSENSFRNLFENAPLPYQSLDIEGNFLSVNQAWLDMMGCQPNEVIGRFFGDFMTESSKSLVTQTFSQFKKEGVISSFKKEGYVLSPLFELVRRDTGEKRLVTINGRIIKDTQGVFQHTLCILTDVTEQYRLEVELKESEQRFQLLIEKMPLALGLTNNRDELIFINDRFKHTFGYTLKNLPTIEHWWLLAYPDKNYRQQVIATWTAAVEKAAHLGTDIEPLEYRITCKDGVERVMVVSGIDFAEGHIYTYIDITERKADEETIKQLAFYDPLTNLPNRRLLNERIKHGIEINHRKGDQMAVLMMDLDKFKEVNDTLGHAAGDELLKQVAERIKIRLREIDTVARLGGDEFVILIEEVKHYEDVAQVAEAIIHTLSQPFTLYDSHQVTISASIGIAIHPDHGKSIGELMDNADTALYQAKDSGRGCFVYFSAVSSI